MKDKCCFKGKNQKLQKQKQKSTIDTTANKRETNVAETESHVHSDVEMLVAFAVPKDTMIENDPFIDNIDMYLASSTNNETTRVYNWLADTGSTHHITNWQELFRTYELTLEATAQGVGSIRSQVLGRGTITLIAEYGTHTCTLNLENVNYIPSNKYNIFALGQWDDNGQTYQASGGELTLIDRQGIPVLKGPKIVSNMYTFHLKPHAITNKTKMYMLSCKESKQS